VRVFCSQPFPARADDSPLLATHAQGGSVDKTPNPGAYVDTGGRSRGFNITSGLATLLRGLDAELHGALLTRLFPQRATVVTAGEFVQGLQST
jgi:hypothetical protein